MAARIVDVHTETGFPIIVFGDTTGFTRFLIRTIEDHSVVKNFLRILYENVFLFQDETSGRIKLECDGFISIHHIPGKASSTEATKIAESCERLYKRMELSINAIAYPRPDGFRIRIAGGRPAVDIKIGLTVPITCTNQNCLARELRDTIGYSGILADRMLQIHKEIPLMCCEAIYEMISENMPDFEFSKVSKPRKVPDGVFREDIQTLWKFRRREDAIVK